MTTNFYSHWDWGGAGTMSELLTRAKMHEVFDPDKADIIVFNGGSDIATEIYNEEPVFRGIPRIKSKRDTEEIRLFNEYKNSGKLLLGICRGAQLLNCLNGGSLWQHVDNHTSDHGMVDVLTGNFYSVTSTHHQMMRPTNEALIIGVAGLAKNKHAQDTHVHIATPASDDIEIVWYGNTRCLCIQGHPEYVPNSRFAKYALALIDQYRCAA